VATPCKTITHGISQMNGGDTLTIGDGTYAEQIQYMPAGIAPAGGAAGQYTTIKATNDWGVTIDGSGLPNTYQNGIKIGYTSWVTVRGFHVIMNQTKTNNGAVAVPGSHHVRVQRVSAGYGGSHDPTGQDTTVNVANIDAGPGSSYVLFEENFAYGGGRYNFIAYQSDHIVFRRNVSRIDHYNGSIQCAGFANYNAYDTLFQNNIVLDSDGTGCYAQGYGTDATHPNGTGRLFAAFWNENKQPDSSWQGPHSKLDPNSTNESNSTRETYRGNIVLNVQPLSATMNDYDISDVHTYSDNIIWDSTGGLFGDYLPLPVTQDEIDHCTDFGGTPCRLPATLNATHMTIGAVRGDFGNAGDQASSRGTGFSVANPAVNNLMTKSALLDNNSYGMADFAKGHDNAYAGNKLGSFGNSYNIAPPTAGTNDRLNIPGDRASLKYLPRMEAGSTLAIAGIGADVRYMQGATGTLWGEPGYDTKQTTCLWPFPNEDVIKAKMGAYTRQSNVLAAPGPEGNRGFATGTSMDGSPQTLTKYIWEYQKIAQIPAGNLCP
jgi:hypothetical protein